MMKWDGRGWIRQPGMPEDTRVLGWAPNISLGNEACVVMSGEQGLEAWSVFPPVSPEIIAELGERL